MKDEAIAIGPVGLIKEQLANLKDEVKNAIVKLTQQSCEVDMCGYHIRQSFSCYDEEVYHIECIYIDPVNGTCKVQLEEYADSIDLTEFCVDDMVGIYEELAKVFSYSMCRHRIDY